MSWFLTPFVFFESALLDQVVVGIIGWSIIGLFIAPGKIRGRLARRREMRMLGALSREELDAYWYVTYGPGTPAWIAQYGPDA